MVRLIAAWFEKSISHAKKIAFSSPKKIPSPPCGGEGDNQTTPAISSIDFASPAIDGTLPVTPLVAPVIDGETEQTTLTIKAIDGMLPVTPGVTKVIDGTLPVTPFTSPVIDGTTNQTP